MCLRWFKVFFFVLYIQKVYDFGTLCWCVGLKGFIQGFFCSRVGSAVVTHVLGLFIENFSLNNLWYQGWKLFTLIFLNVAVKQEFDFFAEL